MKNDAFENETMSRLLAWHADNEATIDEAVVHFLQNNSDEWMNWLSEDARARVQGMF